MNTAVRAIVLTNTDVSLVAIQAEAAGIAHARRHASGTLVMLHGTLAQSHCSMAWRRARGYSLRPTMTIWVISTRASTCRSRAARHY